jgi:hypothetical protein
MFHGGNTGSIPVGRASKINNLLQSYLARAGSYGKNTAYMPSQKLLIV